ncbi:MULTISPECIES: hypothetical protein [Vitreoscilla]|uniref:Serine endopeptidase n=1 Tax=Vitreoscilla stercoraria TaxID=61 RepID=A0ABY4E8Z0_VITST|nr:MULTISPECIES: hypothetical protein [Vitreoscilla]AUZ06500.2 hypothetical protein ADP71_33640 [Vitreoscilla sp. C1]UOO92214.1 serine endopeptidase [Vitreoscilla stercoraria]
MRIKKQTVSSNRLPEKWFRRGLWLVALVFASFLIGLGGKIVGDLPQVTPYQNVDTYLDAPQYLPLQQEQNRLQAEQTRLQAASEQAQLTWEQRRNQTQSEQFSLNNWLATRAVTEQSDQNPEVLARTQKLDALKQQERQAQMEVEALQQQNLNATQQLSEVDDKITKLREQAQNLKDAADRQIELQVFLYRLALTLPLLLVATYLFLKQRQSKWWPFVWGFIYFALFAFFVELVPYLPSYGGYVRYGVGIVLTVLIGRYAIVAMNRYLERKQLEEALPSSERQQQLSYDMAHTRIAKAVCPSCERPTDFNNPHLDFCPHCGIGLFHACGVCQSRKNAFNQYCHQCGAADTVLSAAKNE